MHYRVETASNDLKQKFHIPKMRSVVKKMFQECVHCKKLKVVPKLLQMSDLPDFRLIANLTPFTHTGLDFIGPILVKIGRRQEKKGVAIYTCLNRRAIHIEVAWSLSTDSAIMASRRFRGRRGEVQ
jgi:hypothetical protein